MSEESGLKPLTEEELRDLFDQFPGSIGVGPIIRRLATEVLAYRKRDRRMDEVAEALDQMRMTALGSTA